MYQNKFSLRAEDHEMVHHKGTSSGSIPSRLTAACIFSLSLLLVPGLAHAHSVGPAGGLLAGLWHPVLGFDHFLAMVSVGILSAQIGGRAIWSVPLTFVSVMIGGALLGMNGINIVEVEVGIAFSVVALGIALAAEKKVPTSLAMLAVGIFAIFHGHAHGAEMPEIVTPLLYASGFVAGTAAIHILGVFIGVICSRNVRSTDFLRFVGAGIAGIGIHLLYILRIVARG